MNYPVRIGIVGGGQLGKMLTLAAKKLGFYVTIIDPTPQSPAGQVADKQIVSDFKDEKTILELGKYSDFITFEIELTNDKALLKLMKKGKIVNPAPSTLGIVRDKLRQKEFLQKNKIPTAKFLQVDTKKDILQAGKLFGYPLMLKARHDAYDGRGNAIVRNEKDIILGIEKLKNRELYVEKFVPFSKELAIMVARSTKGEIKSYPTVQTIHKDNICDTVIAPAPISESQSKKAQKLAKKVVKKLIGAGVFGIEMFLDKNNHIFVNEIAPRVHNSGHYTIEGSITSQFEQHIRAITNLPLGSTDLTSKVIVMKNILGKKNGNGHLKGLEKALQIPNASIHIYGKNESRPQRKMGHITVVGNSIKECLKKANLARKMLTI